MIKPNNLRVFDEQTEFDGGFIYQAAEQAKALFIFAHGAGADMNHEFMTQVSHLLVNKNISILRFNFPYMDKRALDGKRRPPDRMPALLSCYQQLIEGLNTPLPIFIGGKSMGSRVAAMVADEYDKTLSGVVCLGYPFHPPKKPDNLRLAPLNSPLLPTLIIQGDRDTLGNKDEINGYSLGSNCEVLYLLDGDHSFKPRVKSGTTLAANIKQAVDHIVRFINEKS